MSREKNPELQVGIFVTIGVGLLMLSIILLGGAQSILTRHNAYVTHFESVEGLISGAKVMLSGIHVGEVKQVSFDTTSQNIKIDLRVKRSAAVWIRKNTQAEISTQGLLGDKFITLNMGNPEEPELSPGAEIPSRPVKDISQFVSKSDELVASLSRIAGSVDRILKTFDSGNRSEVFFQGLATSSKNLSLLTGKLNHELQDIKLKSAIHNLNSILNKIDSGEGTLGALVNDPALYQDIKSLAGGASRNRIIRNLVRQTIRENEEKATQNKP